LFLCKRSANFFDSFLELRVCLCSHLILHHRALCTEPITNCTELFVLATS